MLSLKDAAELKTGRKTAAELSDFPWQMITSFVVLNGARCFNI